VEVVTRPKKRKSLQTWVRRGTAKKITSSAPRYEQEGSCTQVKKKASPGLNGGSVRPSLHSPRASSDCRERDSGLLPRFRAEKHLRSLLAGAEGAVKISSNV